MTFIDSFASGVYVGTHNFMDFHKERLQKLYLIREWVIVGIPSLEITHDYYLWFEQVLRGLVPSYMVLRMLQF